MVTYVVTGMQVYDDYPSCWVEGVVTSEEEANDLLERSKKQYSETYEVDLDSRDVIFEVHKV